MKQENMSFTVGERHKFRFYALVKTYLAFAWFLGPYAPSAHQGYVAVVDT